MTFLRRGQEGNCTGTIQVEVISQKVYGEK